MVRDRNIPVIGDDTPATGPAQAAFFRMLLGFLEGKLAAHLDYFEGSEQVPATGPVILVPNHQSYFDGFALTVLIWKLTGRKVRIPTNIKALTNPVVRYFQVAGGAVPIDPRDPADTYERIAAQLRRGEVVVIYPEGTRSDGTMLHPFKFGAFNLAADLGVPVVPVSVRGFARILPKGHLRFRRGEKGSLSFGPVIDPRDPAFAGRPRREVAAAICETARDWIDAATFAPRTPADVAARRTAEVGALARRADAALEGLLDQNAELISRRDAGRVRRIVSARRFLRESSFEMELQDLRALGFRVADLPAFRALPALLAYRRRLTALLRRAPDHAYLNYCLGLLHLRLPPVLGGGDMARAVALFETAHRHAARFGYPPERFAHGLATALARHGDAPAARALLATTFGAAGPVSGARALRRRERGISLMRKLDAARPDGPDLPSRSLRGFELVMAQSRISDIVIGQIDGLTDIAQICDAAAALQARHPGLRARVTWPKGRDQRPVFEYLPPDLSRLQVRERRCAPGDAADPRPLWQRVAEEEVNHLFDLSDGYMFRVVWLPETNHVILNVQHALIDGVSLMRLLHEFMACCAGIDPGAELPPTPSALESGPRINLLEKTVGWFHREAFLRARRRFHTWSTLPLAGRLDKGAPLSTECYFAEGEAARFDRIAAACRAQGVTVGGAYAAAIQGAMLHFSGSSLSAREKYYVPMDFSLRRYIPGADSTQEALGLFSGGAPVIFDGDPSASFWQMARSFVEKSQSEIAMKSPLIFHQVFDRFWNLEKQYQKYDLHCVEAGGAGGPLTMSNVGKFPYPRQVGDLSLNAIHGMSASQKGGAMLYFWLRSVNGRFFYSATSISPAATRAFASDFFGLVVFLMEHAAEPGAADLPLRDYLPAAVAAWIRAGRPAPAAQPTPVAEAV